MNQLHAPCPSSPRTQSESTGKRQVPQPPQHECYSAHATLHPRASWRLVRCPGRLRRRAVIAACRPQPRQGPAHALLAEPAFDGALPSSQTQANLPRGGETESHTRQPWQGRAPNTGCCGGCRGRHRSNFAPQTAVEPQTAWRVATRAMCTDLCRVEQGTRLLARQVARSRSSPAVTAHFTVRGEVTEPGGMESSRTIDECSFLSSNHQQSPSSRRWWQRMTTLQPREGLAVLWRLH